MIIGTLSKQIVLEQEVIHENIGLEIGFLTADFYIVKIVNSANEVVGSRKLVAN